MNISFLQDLPIDPPEAWTKMRWKDWLHPGYGPLPDALALIEGDSKRFQVAVWLTTRHILVALELFQEDPESQHHEDLRGKILQTFRWTIDPDREILVCRNFEFRLPDIEDDAQWRAKVVQTVMEESVRICLNTTVGTPWKAH